MANKLSQFAGSVVGGLLTGNALALWVFAGNPLYALIWAVGLALK